VCVATSASSASLNRFFLTFGEPAPRLHLYAVGSHEFLVDAALKERVDFDLVDRGHDVTVLDEIDEPVRVEVRHADGANETLGVQMLHGSPRAVAVAEGLVDQVQVHVIETEPFEGPRGGDGLLGLVRGDLEDTETEDAHLDAVVERDGGDLSGRHALGQPGPASR
jgi:hypothetical protein